MVGAFDRGDAVDLDEAQPLDQPREIFSLRRAPKAVPVQEQVPGGPVGEAQQRLAGTVTHNNPRPDPLNPQPITVLPSTSGVFQQPSGPLLS